MKPRDENALETHFDEHIQQWCLCGLAHNSSVLLTSNLDLEFALTVSGAQGFRRRWLTWTLVWEGAMDKHLKRFGAWWFGQGLSC